MKIKQRLVAPILRKPRLIFTRCFPHKKKNISSQSVKETETWQPDSSHTKNSGQKIKRYRPFNTPHQPKCKVIYILEWV